MVSLRCIDQYGKSHHLCNLSMVWTHSRLYVVSIQLYWTTERCSFVTRRLMRTRSFSRNQTDDLVTNFPALEEGWAWVVALVGATIHVLTRGVLFSTGVLFSEWTEFFGHSKGDTAWIGSIATGSALLLGPITSRMIEKLGYRKVGMMGGMICTIGFLASYFATGIYYLYVSYGCIAGGGLGMSYLSGVIAVGEYFDERRSIAFGIAASGAGFGTAVMAMLQRALLDGYGWQGTMLLLAAISGCNQIVCGALLRPLSSSLNWRSRSSKIRLLNHGSHELKECLQSNSQCDQFQENVICSRESLHSKNTLPLSPKFEQNRSEDSGFTGSGKETRSNPSIDSLNLSTSDGKYRKFPNRLRTFSGSDADHHVPWSPSLRRHILNKAAERDFSSMHNVGNDYNQKKGTSPFTNGVSHKSAMTINHHSHANTPNRRLQTADALYLSSLSIVSSKVAARNLRGEKKSTNTPSHKRSCNDLGRKSVNQHLTPTFSQVSTPCRPGSYYSEVYCAGSECDLEYASRKKCDQKISSPVNSFKIIDEKENSATGSTSERKYPHLLRNPLFYVIGLNQFFTGLGVLVPFVHVTEKAILMGLGTFRAVLLISFIGIGNVVGKIVLGMMCDMKCFNILNVFILSQIGLAISVLMVPIISSFELLVFFALSFGFCYGNYSAIPSLTADYVGIENLAQAMGYITFLEGVSAIIGPPMAGHIYDVTLNYNIAFAVAGFFLAASCLMFLPQPIFYERITGKPSGLKLFFEKWIKRKTSGAIDTDEETTPHYNGQSPKKVEKISDINANFS